MPDEGTQINARLQFAADPAEILKQLLALPAHFRLRADFWLRLAAAQFSLKRPYEALASCQSALKIGPNEPDVHFNLGVIYTALQQTPAAAKSYEICLSLDPHHEGGLRNQPSLLFALGQADAALALSERALATYPKEAWAHYNHADLLLGFRQPVKAEALFRQALMLRPDFNIANMGLSVALSMQGFVSEAVASQSLALTSEPSLAANYHSPLRIDYINSNHTPDPARIAALAIVDKHKHFEWQHYFDDIALFKSLVCGEEGGSPLSSVEMPYLSLLLPLDSSVRQQLARQVASKLTASVNKVKLVRGSFRPKSSSGKITIAYLSADLHFHPITRLFGHVFGMHDRKWFNVFAYSTGPNDHSAERALVQDSVDCFYDVRHMPPQAIAQRMVHDEIDILVDLSGYSLHAKPATLMLRPAPIQVNFLGFIGTIGSPHVDYTLLDHNVFRPEQRPYWDEAIAFMPHSYYPCPAPPTYSSIADRSRFGLPPDAIVLSALHNPRKLNPACLALWFSILEEAPGAVLWFFCENEAQRNAILVLADDHGIKRARLIFSPQVPFNEYLLQMRCADIFLDVPHYNGGTTSIDILGNGVPIVTLAGNQALERMGHSLLSAHKLPELIANDADEYVAIVRRFANDADWRHAISLRARNVNGSNLFNPTRWVRELEQAYRLMWKRHCDGLPPADFDVPPVAEV